MLPEIRQGADSPREPVWYRIGLRGLDEVIQVYRREVDARIDEIRVYAPYWKMGQICSLHRLAVLLTAAGAYLVYRSYNIINNELESYAPMDGVGFWHGVFYAIAAVPMFFAASYSFWKLKKHDRADPRLVVLRRGDRVTVRNDEGREKVVPVQYGTPSVTVDPHPRAAVIALGRQAGIQKNLSKYELCSLVNIYMGRDNNIPFNVARIDDDLNHLWGGRIAAAIRYSWSHEADHEEGRPAPRPERLRPLRDVLRLMAARLDPGGRLRGKAADRLPPRLKRGWNAATSPIVRLWSAVEEAVRLEPPVKRHGRLLPPWIAAFAANGLVMIAVGWIPEKGPVYVPPPPDPPSFAHERSALSRAVERYLRTRFVVPVGGAATARLADEIAREIENSGIPEDYRTVHWYEGRGDERTLEMHRIYDTARGGRIPRPIREDADRLHRQIRMLDPLLLSAAPKIWSDRAGDPAYYRDRFPDGFAQRFDGPRHVGSGSLAAERLTPARLVIVGIASRKDRSAAINEYLEAVPENVLDAPVLDCGYDGGYPAVWKTYYWYKEMPSGFAAVKDELPADHPLLRVGHPRRLAPSWRPIAVLRAENNRPPAAPPTERANLGRRGGEEVPVSIEPPGPQDLPAESPSPSPGISRPAAPAVTPSASRSERSPAIERYLRSRFIVPISNSQIATLSDAIADEIEASRIPDSYRNDWIAETADGPVLELYRIKYLWDSREIPEPDREEAKRLYLAIKGIDPLLLSAAPRLWAYRAEGGADWRERLPEGFAERFTKGRYIGRGALCSEILTPARHVIVGLASGDHEAISRYWKAVPDHILKALVIEAEYELNYPTIRRKYYWYKEEPEGFSDMRQKLPPDHPLLRVEGAQQQAPGMISLE